MTPGALQIWPADNSMVLPKRLEHYMMLVHVQEPIVPKYTKAMVHPGLYLFLTRLAHPIILDRHTKEL